MLYSFDIFDTLLVRACGAPEIVFDILADRILSQEGDGKKRAFAAERIRAGWSARDKTPNNSDPKLSEIYNIADFSPFTNIDNETIMHMEMEVESNVLTGVDEMRKIVEECRTKGNVCFTSDMYLPTDFLVSILKREGFFRDSDKIYISCDAGESKLSGNLFKEVLAEHGNERFVHFGDNRLSDGKMMRKATGGKYVRVKHKFTPYQKKIAELPDFNQSQRPLLLASISKTLYLSQGARNDAVKFACDIIAPTLVPVVYEIMARASKAGCRKLFFFARDGKIMHDIAKELSPLFPEIDIEYLYISRTSIYVPSLKSIDIDSLNSLYLPMKYGGYTASQFITKYMPGLGTAAHSDYRTMEEVWDDTNLLEAIRRYHREQQLLVNEYFEDCGFATDADIIGGVDLNGTGKTFECLDTILSIFNHKRIHAFLYNLSYTTEMAKRGDIDSITISERRYGHYDRISGLIYIFEDYIAATDNGRTTHYARDNQGKVIPVLEDEPIDLKEEHKRIYILHSKICREYAKYFITTGAYSHNNVNISLVQNLLKDFGRNPLKEYIRPLTGQSYDVSALSTHAIVKRLKSRDIIKLIKTKGNYSSWARGSVVATYGVLGNIIISLLGKLKYYRANN